jgi:hypothetical protein
MTRSSSEVDPGSEADEIARELAGSSSQNVRVIECRKGAAKNPKVSKLLQIAEFTRHEHWIILDSEAIIGPAFASAFRSEWQQTGADLITAGYRFSGTANLPQRLDAMSTVLTLWPGLEIVRAFGTMRFTLGACTGVRRSDLQAIGSWASLGDDLPEDYWLGERLSRLGKTVCLSEAIVTLDADDLTWGEYLAAPTQSCRYLPVRPAGWHRRHNSHPRSQRRSSRHPPSPARRHLPSHSRARHPSRACRSRRSHPRIPTQRQPISARPSSPTWSRVPRWVRAWFVRSVWWGGRLRRITWRGKLGPDTANPAGTSSLFLRRTFVGPANTFRAPMIPLLAHLRMGWLYEHSDASEYAENSAPRRTTTFTTRRGDF